MYSFIPAFFFVEKDEKSSLQFSLQQQLRQFFSVLPYSGTRLETAWRERRQCVLAGLSQAENNGAVKCKIQGLPNSVLILGQQTVRNSGSWEAWVSQLESWLEAIEQGHRPSATFLLPHNDFGPDVIFALRRKDGGSIVLCSVQVSASTSIIPNIQYTMDG